MTASVSESVSKIVNGDAKNCQEPTNVQKKKKDNVHNGLLLYILAWQIEIRYGIHVC